MRWNQDPTSGLQGSSHGDLGVRECNGLTTVPVWTRYLASNHSILLLRTCQMLLVAPGSSDKGALPLCPQCPVWEGQAEAPLRHPEASLVCRKGPLTSVGSSRHLVTVATSAPQGIFIKTSYLPSTWHEARLGAGAQQRTSLTPVTGGGVLLMAKTARCSRQNTQHCHAVHHTCLTGGWKALLVSEAALRPLILS